LVRAGLVAVVAVVIRGYRRWLEHQVLAVVVVALDLIVITWGLEDLA
jgi:hypothetical protein